ncbi:MAG TPA: PH domain-containing protein [Blastocatellia bacterium]|nr:PH domain-containing protein [Blastocatellia bacterium]
MKVDKDLAAKFKAVKSAQEVIVWAGKPSFAVFASGTLLGVVLVSVLACLIFYFASRDIGFHISVLLVLISFFVLAFLIGLGQVIALRNKVYAITSERVIVRGGLWRPSFTSIGYDCLSTVSVRLAVLDGIGGVGTIELHSGRKDSAGNSMPDKITGVGDPYDVFKKINECLAKYRESCRGSQVAAVWPSTADPIEIDLSVPFDPRQG